MSASSGNSWRRWIGGFFMSIGGLAAFGATLVGVVVTYHFVEWENVSDALSTIGMIIAPVIAAGAVVIFLGRGIYGGWRQRRPVRRISSTVFRLSGLAVSALFAGLFLLRLFAGVGPGQVGAIIQYTVCLVLGLAVLQVGQWLRDDRKTI